MLHLAFVGLGASDAQSVSFPGNPAPLRISRSFGYEDDGLTRDSLRGQVAVLQRLRLTRSRGEVTDRPEATATGLEPRLPLFGAMDRCSLPSTEMPQPSRNSPPTSTRR